jgi:oxalate decarboxylase
MHFCIFFDQPTPADIGYRTSGIGHRASVSAYSRKVLATTFDAHIDDLPDFPFTKSDPLIVNRLNPLDAHAVGVS